MKERIRVPLQEKSKRDTRTPGQRLNDSQAFEERVSFWIAVNIGLLPFYGLLIIKWIG